MTLRTSLVTALAAAAMAALAPSAQALTLYDDFTATTFDPAKWYGAESVQFGATAVESRRWITSGRARLEIKGFSDNKSNAGVGRVRNQLYLESSQTVTAIKTTLTPRTVTFTTCGANSTPGEIRFRIIGGFFNIGSTTEAGNSYNDVFAGIQAYRLSNSTDADGVMHVSGFVSLCTDNTCLNTTTVGTVDLGTTLVGSAVDLSVTLDKAGNQFIFQKNTDATQAVTYTFSDTKSANNYGKRLEAQVEPQNCSATRGAAQAVADFDNVFTTP